MKKKMLIIIMTMLMLMLTSTTYANEKDEEKSEEYFHIFNEKKSFNNSILPNLSMSIYYRIESELISMYLYPQFDSEIDAISKVQLETKNLLKELKKEYNLDELNQETWSKYNNALNIFISGDNKLYSEISDEVIKLKALFNGLENRQINNNILKMIEKNNSKELIYNIEFINMLPYRINELTNRNEISCLNKTKSFVSSDNIVTLNAAYSNSDALSYAKKHATSRNGQFPSYSADCTNFTSQIMYAGGMEQEYTVNVNSGWWHRFNPIHNAHTNSLSWSVAHNFVSYFKIYTGTRYHSQFSRDLKTGDFIALDYESDGRIDHMGYVMQTSVIEDTYEGHKYRRYKVAQHTSDYIEWTTSDKNGWKKYNLKGTYYIVRP